MAEFSDSNFVGQEAYDTIHSMLIEQFTSFIQTERGRQAGIAINIIMSIFLLMALVSGVSNIWDAIWAGHEKPVMHVALTKNKDQELVMGLPREHLFGQRISASSTLPITSLQLQLTGIMKVGISNESKALISESGKPAQVYGVGDVLPSGIKVYAVNEDEVVLERDGHLEKLPLARSPLSFEGLPKPLEP